MRRELPMAVLAATLIVGAIVATNRLYPEPPSTILAFRQPQYRVVMATDRALRQVGASVKPINTSTFTAAQAAPGSARPLDFSYELDPEINQFWGLRDGPKGTLKLALFGVRYYEWTGKAADGRTIAVALEREPIGESGALIDCKGDARLAAQLGPIIEGLLAHPDHPHNSPEDRAAVAKFFLPAQPAPTLEAVARSTAVPTAEPSPPIPDSPRP